MVKIGTKRYWQCFLGSMMVIGMSLLSTTGQAFASTNPNPNVFSPTAPVFGKTYAQWSVRWWQRQFSLTTKQFQSDCRLKQSGPVFLFDGVGAPIKCTIPEGKAIFFPVFTDEQSTLDPPCFPAQNPPFPAIFPPGKSDTALRNCAIANINYITKLEVDIDGQPLQDLMTPTYLVTSAPFNFNAVKNGAFGSTSGKGRGVSDGVWIMLRPLSAGEHHVHVVAILPFPQPVGTFTKDVTYTVTIKG